MDSEDCEVIEATMRHAAAIAGTNEYDRLRAVSVAVLAAASHENKAFGVHAARQLLHDLTSVVERAYRRPEDADDDISKWTYNHSS